MAEEKKEVATAKKATKKPAVKKTTTKKTTKPAVKKSTAKKPATKKATPKKVVAKKPAAKKATPKKPVKKAPVVSKVEAPKEEPKVEEVKPEIKVETITSEQNTPEELRMFKIISYIGILWLVGFFVKSKENKDLKFHMGQGIMLTIAGLLLSGAIRIFNNVLIFNIFRTKTIFWGYESSTVSGFGLFLAGFLNFAVLIVVVGLMVIGIMNATSDKNKKLPIIGKYSFFK